MKRTLLSIAAVAATALPSLNAAVSVVIRPTIAYVNPEADGYDDAAYAGVAGGVTIDAKGQHEFTGEVGFTGWDRETRMGSTRISGTETYVPVLASYRFYFQPVESKFRVFVSPSVGFTHVLYEAEWSAPGYFAKDDGSDIRATGAIAAGFDVRFSEKLSLTAGYRYLYIDSGEADLFGATVDVDEAKAHVVFAGLNIRF